MVEGVRKMPSAKTAVISLDAHDPEPEAIEQAARVIRGGGLVVVPTDTVYGLVADPGQLEAVERIYQVKQRGRDLPLSLLLHDMSQVSAYVQDVPELAVRVMQEFWPGALTAVVGNCLQTTAAVCAGLDSVGLRLPAHVVPRLVAGSAGCALASTSANLSGQPAARTAEDALRQLDGLVALVLDAGPTPLGQESTVVSFVERPPRLLRAGAISLARLREALGEVQEKWPPI
jgi:L-threonylcarbamoyladenylate synthase